MKNLGFKRRNFIALAIATVVALSGFGVYHAYAADAVDVDKTVTITAKVAEDDASVFASNYNGYVKVKLYKIADLDTTGKATLTENFSDAGIDLTILDDSPSVDDVKEKIVAPAVKKVNSASLEEVANLTVTVGNVENIATDTTEEISPTAPLKEGAGIYLYIPKAVQDSRYSYEFLSYVIYAPGSNYISTGTGSDEWQYDVSFNLKSSAEQRYGDLEIKKSLATYNESLGSAAFVYQVEATLDNKTVHSNVYSMNFDNAGDKSITIKNIPAGATVTVTEVYSGASYEMTASSYTMNETEAKPIIVADKALVANFTNDYDFELQVGGISITNSFERNADGEYEYTGNNLTTTEGGNE